MSENRDDLIKQFQEVTGTDENQSRFFLESCEWRAEEAISRFFEQGGTLERPTVMVSDSSDPDSPPISPPPVFPIEKKEKKNVRTGNVATLKNLEESDSDEDREAFFAGGSERSGQQILGPGRKDVVAEMFRSVREHGAVEEDAAQPSRSSGFSGAGYKLGATADDHTVVPPPQSAGNRNQLRSVRLQLFKEGFTVDEGPIRQYTDPNNAMFLDYVRRGEVPPELATQGEVRVSLEDRRHEDCPKSKVNLKPFQGQGHMLGSPTPPTVGATAPVASSVEDRAANERAAQSALGLDESAPTTTIQFRLADGSRLAGRFNYTHTVADMRQYIITAVPTYQLQNFILLTSYPSRELTDIAQTIDAAKLQNSVVLQRVK